MSEEQESLEAELQRELEEERALNAKVHRHMGMTATILVLVAIGIALYRIPTMFGVSPSDALGLGATTIPVLLIILGLGVVFSMGTTRILFAIERISKLFRGDRT